MVLATMPRVLAPGELVDLPVTVFAMDAKVKDVVVKLEPNALLIPEGPVQRTIKFNKIGDQVVYFKVRVKEAIGVAKVKVSVSGAGESASEAIDRTDPLPMPWRWHWSLERNGAAHRRLWVLQEPTAPTWRSAPFPR